MSRRVCEVTGCRKWKDTTPTKMNVASVGCQRVVGGYRLRVWLCPSHHKEAHRTVWRSIGRYDNANTNINYTASTASNWFVSSGTTANSY